ncbi:MAG: threonine synthase [Syntrophomonadaceae bacterium]|nr:threonine synthase [Syntrophomonadaceae bacterium]
MNRKASWRGIVEEYREYLPVTDETPVVSLQEGNTPLVFAPNISDMVGAEVYLKFEGGNPTGSFKDRGMAMAMSKAKEEGAEVVMCASTGNTSASAAAFAARCGIRCVVLIPDGKIAQGKLAQALIYGAQVLAVDGNFDQALTIVTDITSKHPVTLVNSLNPFRIEGQKTGAFEICDRLGGAPDYLAIPVGNAGNITAYWKGFLEYHRKKVTQSLPKMIGFQAEGAAPIVRREIVLNPETVATAIRIGSPASWHQAVEAAHQSAGSISAVSDEEILNAYKLVARKEGLFVEPASAAPIAGILKKGALRQFQPDQKIVCILTGHGLKDPDNAVKTAATNPEIVPADEKSVLKVIFG